MKWWGENDSFVFIDGYFCGGPCLFIVCPCGKNTLSNDIKVALIVQY